MPMTKDEVFAKIKEVLTTALAVDEDEVTPDAKLFDDLGAESIDILDIQFQIEKAFGFKVAKDLTPDSALFSNPEYVQNGKVTPKGIAEIKNKWPFADLTAFEANPEVTKVKDIFTVDMLVRYVMTKVG